MKDNKLLLSFGWSAILFIRIAIFIIKTNIFNTSIQSLHNVNTKLIIPTSLRERALLEK